MGRRGGEAVRVSGYDVAVVGAGPLGAATARHLAEAGHAVVIIGPAEPVDHRDHRGTWAGHYDQGRIAHVLEVPLITALLTRRAMSRFDALEEATGVRFAHPVDSVTVLPGPEVPTPGSWFDADVLRSNARDLGVPIEEADAAGLASRYPGVHYEPGHAGLIQRSARIVDPRALTAAELAAAQQAGAQLVRATVVERIDEPGAVTLIDDAGTRHRADQVVLATGAATGMTGLLDRRPDLHVFGATAVLARVPAGAAVDMPTSMYMKMRGGERLFGGIVMSPRPYADGHEYVKVSGTGLLNHPLADAEAIAQFVRTGGDDSEIAEAADLLADLIPSTEFTEFSTTPGIVCATATGMPYIDRVDERTVVAIEGERGAMSGDEIGRLAAQLATGPWRDTVPGEVFRLRWV